MVFHVEIFETHNKKLFKRRNTNTKVSSITADKIILRGFEEIVGEEQVF